MENHLISMVDFVLYQCAQCGIEPRLARIERYARFLKKPTTLGMFIPCDLEGNILVHPDFAKITQEEFEAYRKKYVEANNRVLFEGFSYQSNFSSKQNQLYQYVKNGVHVFSFEQIKSNTIESLLTGFKKEFLIKITDTGMQEIGIKAA